MLCAFLSLSFIAGCFSSKQAAADEMSFEQLCTYRGPAFINAEGILTIDTASRLEDFIQSADHQNCDYAGRLRVSLSSQEGDIEAGIALGRFFQDHRIIVEIGRRIRNSSCLNMAKQEGFEAQHCEAELVKRSCEGPCALAFLGGLDRKQVFSEMQFLNTQDILGFKGLDNAAADATRVRHAITGHLAETGTSMNFASLPKNYFPTLNQLAKAGVLVESHLFSRLNFTGATAIAQRRPGSSSDFNQLEIKCEESTLAIAFLSDQPMNPLTIQALDVRISTKTGSSVYETFEPEDAGNPDEPHFSFGEGYMMVRITPQTLTWNAFAHMAKEIDFELIGHGAVPLNRVAVQLDKGDTRNLTVLTKQCQ